MRKSRFDWSVVIGKKYGRLTILSIVEAKKGRQPLCLCECGSTKAVRFHSLETGHTKSCGCLDLDMKRQRSTRRTHGMSNHHPIYKSWSGMRDRCYNVKGANYKNWGARGIAVCEEWSEFIVFYNWSMRNGWAKGLSIDRIDNDGPYVPWNCRWANQITQSRNRRGVKLYDFNGSKLSIPEIAEKVGLKKRCLYKRLKVFNMDFDLAVSLPSDSGRGRFQKGHGSLK